MTEVGWAWVQESSKLAYIADTQPANVNVGPVSINPGSFERVASPKAVLVVLPYLNRATTPPAVTAPGSHSGNKLQPPRAAVCWRI